MNKEKLKKIAKLIRYWSLVMTTEAGSGHPTSALSAADLMTGLLFGGIFHFDLSDPKNKNNDRLLFSKGHASPLFYSLWALSTPPAGRREKKGENIITPEELMTFRKFGSRLEGHPTKLFPYTEAASGSLGQGLSVGLGMAINAKYFDFLPYRTYVLMGDSEVAEGSVWEAMQLAAHYKLDNLVGILDVNRLGQRGETMYGYDMEAYEKKISAFGWETIVIDGHDFDQILKAFSKAQDGKNGKPKMIIAKTIKGRGVSFLEDKEGWHGRVLKKDELGKALEALGGVDKRIRGEVALPEKFSRPSKFKAKNFLSNPKIGYKIGEMVATRKAYGQALPRIAMKYRDMAVLDAEVSNSTYSEIFKEKFPDRFLEMYIAEQNMVGTGLGLALRGKIPFISTFAAFFTRAYDQIRMASYSGAHMVFCGSHAGVSIGEDGVSQMGLEDLSLFRSIWNSIVLYPADAVSCDKLVEEAAKYHNISYIRTTRKETPVIYGPSEQFPVGGSKILRKSSHDKVIIVAAGITLHEAIKAADELKKSGLAAKVIDVYCIKPIDGDTLRKIAAEKSVQAVVTVEDHYIQGGLGEAVARVLSRSGKPVYNLAVEKLPRSGKPDELLDYEEISSDAIVRRVKEILKI